ncbi:MAG: hypothetical protein RR115_08220, partial [Hydrogenoanaerobacterium sp.]
MTRTRNFIMASIVLLTAGVLTGAAAFYFLRPVSYVSLDVNPGVEFKTNRLNRIVSMTGANDDAKELLKDYNPKGKKLDTVVDQVVNRMVNGGYIAGDKKNDILITCRNDADSQKALKLVKKQVSTALSEHQMKADILTQNIALDKSSTEDAYKHNISAGKMAVITKLLAQDASLNADDLATTRISELITYAEQHQLALELEDDAKEDAADALKDAKEKEEDAKEDAADALKDAKEKEEDAKEKAADIVKDAKEKEEDAKEDAADALKDAKEKEEDAKEKAADALKDAKEKEEDAKEKAADALKDAKEKEEDAKEKAADALKDAKEKEEDAKEKAADAVKDAKEKEEDAKEKAADALKDAKEKEE